MTSGDDQPPANSVDADHDLAILRAWRLVGEGRMAEAERRLDALLTTFPESRAGWLMKSTAQFHRRNYQGGVESSQRAIELDPADPEGWISKGLCLAEDGLNEAAIECYRTTLHENGNNAAAWRELGKSYGRLDRYSEAIDALKRSIAIDPIGRESWYSLGLSLVALGRLDDALHCYDKALDIDIRSANTWCARAVVFLSRADEYLRSSDPDRERRASALVFLREALRNLDNALRIDPRHEVSRFNRGQLMETFGSVLKGVPSLEGAPGIQTLPEV